MARRLSFRDRFYTPRVARAVTAPSSILLTGAAAAAGILIAGPIGAVAGLAAYGAKVLLAVPRNEQGERIDPFAVGEPWRRFVQEAVAAQRRFDEVVRTTAPGPLRSALEDIGSRLADGVEECWRVAKRGHLIAEGRSRLDVQGARRELAQVEHQLQGRPAQDPQRSRLAQTAEALRAQLDAAHRMETVLDDAVGRLRLLDARLDESVTRAVELSVQSDATGDMGLGRLGSDVDVLVSDMEALRQGLEEVERAGRAAPPPGSPAPGVG